MNTRANRDARWQGHSRGDRRKRRLPLFRVFLATLLLIPAIPGGALISSTITIDGQFADWASALGDPDNYEPDANGDAGSANIDLMMAAATFDTANVYLYCRRASTGGGAPTYYAWIDRGADGRMHTGDRVLEISVGGTNAYGGAAVYRYDAVDDANGDAMPGDAGWPIGSWPDEITPPAGSISGFGEPDGIQLEIAATWESLGLNSGDAFIVQTGSSLGSNRDSVSPISLEHRVVTVTPDGYSGVAAGAIAKYRHTIANTGNVTATYDLTAVSSAGWLTSIVSAADGTPLSWVSLDAGASIDVTVTVSVLETAKDGASDTTTVTAIDRVGGTSGSARDVTTVGSILVIPDQEALTAPGGTAVHKTTITNATDETRTLDLAASSTRSWGPVITDAAGGTVSQVTLNPGASVDVYVRVTVPTGTAYGVRDVTTVEAVDTVKPSIGGRARHGTTCARPVEVSPDNEGSAGPGTVASYAHTVVNSTDNTATISLAASSSMLWSPRVYGPDGGVEISEIKLPPQGGSATVYVRITVPPGALLTDVDTTTLTATNVADTTQTDSADDVTKVSRLVTYADSAYSVASAEFFLGDTVYVRGLGLDSKKDATLRWYRPSDPITPAFTTGPVKPDAVGVLSASQLIPEADDVGQWTIVLFDSADTEVTRATFRTKYRASMSAPDVNGGDTVESTVTATPTLSNDGALPITGTVTGLIWWDADSDGVFDVGDSWIAPDGSWQAYSVGAETASSALTVPAGAIYSPPSWEVSNAEFLETGTYQLTSVWSSGGVVIDSITVGFYGVYGRPLLTITLSEETIDFGTVDPDVTYTFSDLGVLVESNVAFTLTRNWAGSWSELGLSGVLPTQAGVPPGTRSFSDDLSIRVPWETNAGTYSASVLYTIVRD